MVLVDGRPMKLGGRRPQLVLACLLSHANRTVSQDSLIDAVWAGDPPEAAKSTLQSYIYGLRQNIHQDVILRKGDGYRVEVDSGTLDSMRFEELVTGARKLSVTDPAEASEMLSGALELWYGDPYEGLESNPSLLTEIVRLEELRLAAIEMRNEIELHLGNHGELIGALDTLVRQHPLRERFRAQQMLALYRGGRQAEALRAYQEARRQLGDELGIDPSEELKVLEQKILDHDPSLQSQPAGRWGEQESRFEPQPLRGYEIMAPIGSGDFATVYRAQQPSIQREVAVKVIRPELASKADFVRRFEQEAHTISQLDHPHIVPLFDYWRDPDGAYLVMPLMRGGSLEGSVDTEGWSVQRVLTVIEQVGGALAHAHRRGVMHRDVKPANVLLDSEGNAYLSDFGIAQSFNGSEPTPSSSFGSGADLGEVGTDIQGLGNLAFRLLTGSGPASDRPRSRLVDLRPDLPVELDRVLAHATGTQGPITYRRVEDFLRAFRQSIGADVVTKAPDGEMRQEPIRNPYKGLRAFRDSDAADFFGRDALVDELLEALSRNNVVTVVGPSGSGKSSVVRAGLVPALRRGALPGSGQWLITDMFPGSHPFEELEAALLKVAVDHPSNLLTELADENGLLRVTKRILPSEDTTLLLVVDQFEELFSTVRAESSRRSFLDNLVAVAGDERSRIKIVVTLRADYLDRPLTYRAFAEVVRNGLVTVGPPSRDGMAQSISAPAKVVGVEAEPGLINRMISDIENQPGGLPLLQFALTELFASRDGQMLSIAEYEAMGGVRRALGLRAESLYAELPESMQESCRQIFLRMVSLNAGKDTTRRRVSQAELRGLAIDTDTIDQILGRFGRLRLISFDREPQTRNPTVELAHEALIDEWDRLRGWIDEQREALVVARRISDLALEWAVADRDPSFLLRGARLRQTEEWLAATELALTENEVAFIDASLDAERAEESIVQRRRRITTYSLVGALSVFMVLAVVALWQWNSARTQAREMLVSDLASDSVAALDQDPELALLLALESAEVSLAAGEPLELETRNALYAALLTSRLEFRLPREARAVEFAGSTVATINPDGTVSGFSGSDGMPLWTFDKGPSAHEISASPDGAYLAVVYRSGGEHPSSVVILDVASQSEVITLPAPPRPRFVRLRWSSDSQRLLVIGGEESTANIALVQVATGEALFEFTVPEASDFALLDHGTVAVSFPDQNAVVLYGPEGLETGETLSTPGFAPGPIAYDASANHLILGGVDGKRAQAWDLSTRDMIWETTLPHPTSEETVLEVSDQTRSVAIAVGGGAVMVLDLDDGHERFMLRSHLRQIEDLDFDPDGTYLVSTARDEAGRVWKVGSGAVSSSPAGPEPPCGLIVAPDGSRVAITGTDGTFSIVDIDQGTLLRSIPDQHIHYGYWATVSEGFDRMAWEDHDGVSRVWDVDTGDEVAQLPPCHRPMALSHDGSRVVVEVGCTQEKSGSVIDAATGDVLVDLGAGAVWNATFTSAGGSEPSSYVIVNIGGNTLDVYEISGRRITSIEADEGDTIESIAVDPSGLYLAVGSFTGSATVYSLPDLVSGRPVEAAIERVVKISRGHVGGISITEDYLATSSFALLEVWDIATGDLLASPPIEIDNPPFSAFSPDGSTLIYTDGEYELRRLFLDPDQLLAHTRERLTRDFTEQECLAYLGGPCA